MNRTIAPGVLELLRKGVKARNDGEIGDARQHFQLALDKARHEKDAAGEAEASGYLGGLLRRYYDAEAHEARKLLVNGLRIHKHLKSKRGVANVLMELGTLDYREDKLRESEKQFTEAARIFDQLLDRNGQARIIHQLGLLERKRGNHELAEKHFRKALMIFDGLNDRKAMGTVLKSLGGSYLLHDHNPTQAKSTWEHALQLLEETGDVIQAQDIRENLQKLEEEFGPFNI